MRHRGLRAARSQITNRELQICRPAILQITNCKLQMRQRGYMMITLMLTIALLTIAGLAALPMIRQQIQRDREEEMIHRGTAYMRAIQHFYKKLGRYPTRVEELEDTNNIRYLRKRYTDPLSIDRSTGKEKEFKYLHQMDILLNNGPALGQMPGAGGIPGPGGSGNQTALLGALEQAVGSGDAGALLGQLQQAGGGNAGAMLGALQQAGATSAQIPAIGDSGNAASDNPSSGNSADAGGNTSSPGSSPSGPSGQVFGGGPILGVASTSKAKSIREFYGKSHYKDWYFIYMPQAITMGLLKGPVNPNGTTPNFNGINPNQTQPSGLSNQPGNQPPLGSSPTNSPTPGFPTIPPDSPAPAPPPQQ
jgi:type II secretory pathway pseudopilin PulG